ncbi:hypothetical protein [Paenibacillus sp. WLX2291]|uniref:hypothetical protein n=1 Tax=Paenibacillus sp. WLX2291 TaxID=3296934 RepID=UPI0039845D8C
MIMTAVPLVEDLVRSHCSVVDTARIRHMELFVYDHQRLALPDHCEFLHCGLLRVCGNGVAGWAEFEFSDGTTHLDLVKWASVFTRLKGQTSLQAIQYIQQHESQWGFTRTHLAGEALVDWHKSLLGAANAEKSSLDAGSVTSSLPVERNFLNHYCSAYYSF